MVDSHPLLRGLVGGSCGVGMSKEQKRVPQDTSRYQYVSRGRIQHWVSPTLVHS